VSCGVFSDSDVSQSFDVVVKLPTVNIVKLPVYVELDIPSVISVQSSAVVVYTIHNRSDSLQDFDVIVESSDAFMFAGHRQVSVLYVIVFVLIATFLSLLWNYWHQGGYVFASACFSMVRFIQKITDEFS